MKFSVLKKEPPAWALTSLLLFISLPVSAGSEFNNVTFHPVPLSDVHVSGITGLANSNLNPDLSIQPLASSSASAVEQHRRNLHQLEITEGPYSILIAEQAERLGDLLVEFDDLDGARSSYEKAMQVTRINSGIVSTEQEPILRKMILVEKSAQNINHIDELQQSLHFLTTRLYQQDSAEYIHGILEWADWKAERFLMAAGSPTNQSAGSPLPATSHLQEAQKSYIEAINLISKSDSKVDHNNALAHAEKRLAAINTIAAKVSPRNEKVVKDDFSDQRGSGIAIRDDRSSQLASFFNGNKLFKQAIANALEAPQPDYLYIAEQMMSLGDWNLLYGRKTAALSIYENAYEVLDAMQVPQSERKRIMNSGMPLSPSISTFTTDGSKTPEFQGYIDIEMTVSKFGTATKPAIIGSSQNLESPLTRALIRQIRSDKFRPAFIDGSATGSDNLKLRYYYSYN